MKDFRRLSASCRSRLRALPLPNPFDLNELCRRIAQQRGRDLELVAFPEGAVPATVTGMWWPGPERDYIFHQPVATELHRRQYVLHELAHMTLGHTGVDIADAAAHSPLFVQLNPARTGEVLARRDVLMRHGRYDQAEEAEAEMLASLLNQYAMRHAPAHEDPFVSRLAVMLDHTAA